MPDLSPEAQAIINGADRDGLIGALHAAADQLPTTSPHPYPSQIYYNGSAMAANMLRQWACELNQFDSLIP